MVPQIIYLLITFLGLGMHLARHGEQRNEKYNFGAALFSTLITLALLWWGGFFS